MTFLVLLGCGTPTATGGGGATVQVQDATADADLGDASDGSSANDTDSGPAVDATATSLQTLPPQRRADLDAFAHKKLGSAHVPSCAAGIVKNGHLAWQGAWGYANVAQEQLATADHLYMLASISKTATAVGVMRAVQEGLAALDDDVNAWLPFAVHHPKYPNVPITLRLLLTHFSGIADNWDVMDTTYVEGDSPVALSDFLHDYLASDGKYYDASANFGTKKPGTTYDYSDIGMSLAAYAVEVKTKVPFDQWCADKVFAPLGMTQTAFRLKGLNTAMVALPYAWTKAGGYKSYGLYGYPDYPDGALRSSVPQMARFLLMFMNGGTWNGAQILAPATVAEMKKVQYPDLDDAQLLAWYMDVRDDGATYIGHNGGDRGIFTEMFYRPSDGVGVLLFCNGDVEQGTAAETAILALEARLFVEAGSLQ